MQTYKAAFESLKDELADVDFVIDQLVTSPAQIEAMKNELQSVDGILVIHLSIGIWSILTEILKVGRPTVFFAVPYSGHEWASIGKLEQQPEGRCMEAMLTSDLSQLAVAIRPFRPSIICAKPRSST